MLKLGDIGDDVKALKVKLIKLGFDLTADNPNFLAKTDWAVRDFQSLHGLTVDGIVGPKTMSAIDRALEGDKPKYHGVPWLDEAKKHEGKRETDPKFVAFLTSFWAKVGLPGYKQLSGKSYAWCGVFVASMLIIGGYSYQKNGAGARNWAKYGIEIEYKKDGIPRGAILHINGSGNCSSGSGNHVTFADGDCSAADIAKSGAQVPGFGGNQSDSVKRSMYSVRNVCAVRWPEGAAKPSPVLVSRGCSGQSNTGESTR